MSKRNSARDRRHLVIVVLIMLINQGCGVMRPDPVSLYPDDPTFDPDEAALLNLLPVRPGYTGPVSAWQGVSIAPQDCAAARGSERALKTWVILVPPCSYEFSIKHPYRNYEMPVEVEDGKYVTYVLSMLVDIEATLEAGKHYRIVYVDKPGNLDFEIWETTEDEARSFGLSTSVQPKNTIDAIRVREGL